MFKNTKIPYMKSINWFEKLAQESQKLVEGSNLPMLEAKLAPELEMMKSQLNNMILSNPTDASKLLMSFIKD